MEKSTASIRPRSDRRGRYGIARRPRGADGTVAGTGLAIQRRLVVFERAAIVDERPDQRGGCAGWKRYWSGASSGRSTSLRRIHRIVGAVHSLPRQRGHHGVSYRPCSRLLRYICLGMQDWMSWRDVLEPIGIMPPSLNSRCALGQVVQQVVLCRFYPLVPDG